MHPYRSKDGWLISSDPEAVARWDAIAARQESEKRDWTEILREMGVKFAHPDDGWVDRNADGSGRVTLSWYPQFNDEPKVGDLMAIGTPPDGSYGVDHYVPRGDHKVRWKGDFRVKDDEVESACQGYRIVRVTEVDDTYGILGRHVRWDYEDTGIRVPPVPPRRRWWRRIFSRVA